MRIRPFLALGIAVLAFAPADATERADHPSAAMRQTTAAEPLPTFIAPTDRPRVQNAETYRNAARSADL